MPLVVIVFLLITEEIADKHNEYHIGSQNSGDLWIVYMAREDLVKTGEELFNIIIMKQEKSILSPIDGVISLFS